MTDVYITCQIEQGAFTNERTFQIMLSGRIKGPAGEVEGMLVGTAHRMHLLDDRKLSLKEDEPGFGSKIDGFVRCQVIRELSDGWVLVEVPSADLIHVPREELVTV